MTADDFLTDLPLDVCIRAHAGISWSPESRGAHRRREYAETLAKDFNDLAALADTPEKRAAFDCQFEQYRKGARVRFLACCHADARCLSIMVAGPARFPARRNQKANDVATKRRNEFLAWRERALKAIRRTLQPELAPIMSGDQDAPDRIRARIDNLEREHERLKTIARLWRQLGRPEADDVEAWQKIADDPALMMNVNDLRELRRHMRTDPMKRGPVPGYMLQNNGANIRRLKERLEQITTAQATPETTSQGTAARVEDSPADNRVRLFFPGKPPAEVRERLKRSGFRWAPSLGCWQAYRNPGTIRTAAEVAGVVAA